MGRLSYLLGEDTRPAVSVDLSQLNLGEETTLKVASLIAQETARALEPIALLFEQYAKQLSSESVNKFDDATKILGEIKGQVDKSVKGELEKVEKAIGKSNDAIRASSKNADRIRDGLIKALGQVKIPDYTDALENLEISQRLLAEAIKDIPKDDRPREWDFSVNRNRNGFIQSVTAKAK